MKQNETVSRISSCLKTHYELFINFEFMFTVLFSMFCKITSIFPVVPFCFKFFNDPLIKLSLVAFSEQAMLIWVPYGSNLQHLHANSSFHVSHRETILTDNS